MKDEKNNSSLEEKFRQAIKEVEGQTNKQSASQEITPKMKTGLYIAGAFILVWSSQYIFSAIAGAVRSFKDLRKSIREK